jgi:hypothetical protein
MFDVFSMHRCFFAAVSCSCVDLFIFRVWCVCVSRSVCWGVELLMFLVIDLHGLIVVLMTMFFMIVS